MGQPEQGGLRRDGPRRLPPLHHPRLHHAPEQALLAHGGPQGQGHVDGRLSGQALQRRHLTPEDLHRDGLAAPQRAPLTPKQGPLLQACGGDRHGGEGRQGQDHLRVGHHRGRDRRQHQVGQPLVADRGLERSIRPHQAGVPVRGVDRVGMDLLQGQATEEPRCQEIGAGLVGALGRSQDGPQEGHLGPGGGERGGVAQVGLTAAR